MIFANKHKNIHVIILSFLLATTFVSCKTKKSAQENDEAKFSNYQKATIIKNDMDGCSWMIVLDSEPEKKLEPVNLKEEFKVENQKIWLQYKVHNGMSICMMGQMINITAIEKRK